MITATSRGCAGCGAPITVTSRNPNRRYCTARCRVADWHRRTRAPQHNAITNDVPAANDVPAVPAVANDVPSANAVAAVPRPAESGLAAGSLTRCPHCQTPLTVLTWLLPPAAAHVTTPDRHG